MGLYGKKDLKQNELDSILGSALSGIELPKYKMPDNESNPDAILEIIKDELFLDGNLRQNLAIFCQTWEEKQIHELMDFMEGQKKVYQQLHGG